MIYFQILCTINPQLTPAAVALLVANAGRVVSKFQTKLEFTPASHSGFFINYLKGKQMSAFTSEKISHNEMIRQGIVPMDNHPDYQYLVNMVRGNGVCRSQKS